jgi:hypothetical protein
MNTSDFISILALLVSCISTGLYTFFLLRDRAHVKAYSTYYPAWSDKEGPGSDPGLTIEIANYGRREVLLEYLYFQYGKKTTRFAETTWESDPHGRFHLGEGETYRTEITTDSDGILLDDNRNPATNVYFQDSLQRRYYVKNVRQNIKKYLQATRVA